jgi:ketosteroid isomerase-like protein
VFGQFQFRAKSTGKLMETDWVVRLTMQDSKIARGQFFENTFAIANAFRYNGSWTLKT